MSAGSRGFALAAMLVLAAVQQVAAQSDAPRVPILALPAGTRGLGLGGAYVSGDSPDVLFYNPAAIGSVHGSALTAERIGNATLGQFATTGGVGGFGLGAGVRFVTSGNHDAAGDPSQQRGGELVAGVALATQVRGVWLGGAANYVAPDLGDGGGRAAFDVGAAVREFGLRFGFSAQNLGRDPGVAGDRQLLPTRVSAGASLPGASISTYFDVAASAALSWERGGVLVPRGGCELIYEPLSGWTITGRVGARRPVDRPGTLRESPLSLGGSFGLKALSIDYVFQPAVAGGQAIHSLGIRVQ